MPLTKLVLTCFPEPIIVVGVVQLDDLIEELDQKKPKKSTAQFKFWKKDINTLIDAANRLAGFKRYNLKK